MGDFPHATSRPRRVRAKSETAADLVIVKTASVRTDKRVAGERFISSANQAYRVGGIMVLVSYSGREINAKIVYYGPGLSGKTTNLEYIYSAIPQNHRGKMVSMKTKTERTLFFDFLPIHLGELSGFKTRFLLYTVPGQVYYNATRKLVLKGVDAVVFVADSKRGKMDENIESLENLRTNLKEHGLALDKIPWVMQYNKRDIPDAYSLEELEKVLNPRGVPSYEAVATTGEGVFETFKAVARMLLKHLSTEIGVKVVPSAEGSIEAVGATPGATAPTSKPAEEPVAMTSAPPAKPAPVPPATPPPQSVAKQPPPVMSVEKPSAASQAMTAGPSPEEEDSPAPKALTETQETVRHEEREKVTSPSGLDPESNEVRSNGMGDRLRRWFTRPRPGDELETAMEVSAEAEDPSTRRDPTSPVAEVPKPEEATPPHEQAPRIDERTIPLSISGMSPEPVSAEPMEEALAPAVREVPIRIDLDPEDLEYGVVLKLRISIRRASESRDDAETGTDRSIAA